MALSPASRLQPQGVHQAALLLAFASIINGFLGLMRDRLLAGTYGASQSLDIYYAAFRIPDFIFSLSLFFVASTAFIPLFLEHKRRSPQEARDFVNSIFTFFLVSMVTILIIVYIFLPSITRFLVPGFSLSAQNETTALSRILLLSPLLLGISSLISGIVQASKKFIAYALSPIVYNLGIIAGVLFLMPRFGLAGLAFGVVSGALLHLVVQVPTLLGLHALPRLAFSFRKDSFAIFIYSFPRAFALSVNQFTLFVLTALASTLGIGAIAIFNLSLNLYTLPLVIVGLSYSVAAFPTMAEMALKEDKSIFFEHLFASTRHILFWTMPITALVMVLRAHIVRAVLGTGAFAWVDTRLTIASLLIFSSAIVAQSLVTLFVRGYYALGRTREPVLYNAFASFVTILIALVTVYGMRTSPRLTNFFAGVMRVEDLASVAHTIEFLSLPIAFSVGALVNATLLGASIFRLNGKEDLQKLRASAWNILAVSCGMFLLAYSTLKALSFMNLNTFASVVIQGGVAGFAALIGGIVLFHIFRVPEYFEVQKAIKARFQQRGVIQPETEHL